MASRLFECEECQSYGKITLKGSDTTVDEIVYCPVCSADISVVEEFEEEE